jgi:hypothetical protein
MNGLGETVEINKKIHHSICKPPVSFTAILIQLANQLSVGILELQCHLVPKRTNLIVGF